MERFQRLVVDVESVDGTDLRHPKFTDGSGVKRNEQSV